MRKKLERKQRKANYSFNHNFECSLLLHNTMIASNLSNFVNTGKKIIGVGLNYKSLLRERNLSIPTKPVVFLKPTSCYITEGQDIEIPEGFKVKEEVELGVVIGKKCKNVAVDKVLDYVAGYCVALDLTEPLQLNEIKKSGMPWTFAKGFDTACPVSRFIPKQDIRNPQDVQLWCKINGKMIQDGNTSEMIFPVPEIIKFITRHITLEPGDLVITGSPSGMSFIHPGDVVEAGIKSLAVDIKFNVKAAS